MSRQDNQLLNEAYKSIKLSPDKWKNFDSHFRIKRTQERIKFEAQKAVNSFLKELDTFAFDERDPHINFANYLNKSNPLFNKLNRLAERTLEMADDYASSKRLCWDGLNSKEDADKCVQDAYDAYESARGNLEEAI